MLALREQETAVTEAMVRFVDDELHHVLKRAQITQDLQSAMEEYIFSLFRIRIRTGIVSFPRTKSDLATCFASRKSSFISTPVNAASGVRKSELGPLKNKESVNLLAPRTTPRPSERHFRASSNEDYTSEHLSNSAEDNGDYKTPKASVRQSAVKNSLENGEYITPKTTPDRPQSMVAALFHVKAIFDFEAENETEMDLRTGDCIKVTKQVDECWWSGIIIDGDRKGDQGMFPNNYVEVFDFEARVIAKPRLPAPLNASQFEKNEGRYSKVENTRMSLVQSRITKNPSMEGLSGSRGMVGHPLCAECGCDEFVAHAFKRGCCNTCFHTHG